MRMSGDKYKKKKKKNEQYEFKANKRRKKVIFLTRWLSLSAYENKKVS